jgi:cyanate permease
LLLIIGILALDFAVQVVHVSNQHLLTAAHPDRTSSVIGSYMVFYSLGSALGAAATTGIFTTHGWVGSSLLGAGFAACGLAVWATDRLLYLHSASLRSGKAGTRQPRAETQKSGQAGQEGLRNRL